MDQIHRYDRWKETKIDGLDGQIDRSIKRQIRQIYIRQINKKHRNTHTHTYIYKLDWQIEYTNLHIYIYTYSDHSQINHQPVYRWKLDIQEFRSYLDIPRYISRYLWKPRYIYSDHTWIYNQMDQIIPTDFHIFQRVGIPPTSPLQMGFSMKQEQEY